MSLQITVPKDEKKKIQSFNLTETAIKELKKFQNSHKIKNLSATLDLILKNINK